MSNKSVSQAAARLASAAAVIIKGAMTGGPKGAVVAAALQVAPALIKWTAITLAVLILMPMLVIASVPATLFDFSGSTDPEQLAVTAKAQLMEKAYNEMENTIQLVTSAITLLLGDGYDDVVILQPSEVMDKNWFVAIGSVMHLQDVFAMSGQDVTDNVKKSIEYTLREEEYKEVVKGKTVTKTRLHIGFTLLTPQRLMDKLGFTDEQKNWALVLYNSMVESQTIDGIVTLEDFGNLRFADAQTSVTYYNQRDIRWGGEMYGLTGTIGSSGCGPTALAMVVSSLTGRTVTPSDAAKWSYENGYRAEGNGSSHALIPNGAEHYGLKVEKLGCDWQRVIDALKDGKLVVAIMSQGHFTGGGHFIVLRGVTSKGKVLIADPNSLERSSQEWDMGLILGEANRNAGAGGPFWAVGP